MDFQPSQFNTFDAPVLEDVRLSDFGSDGVYRGSSGKRQYKYFYKKKIAVPVTVKAEINPKTGLSIPQEIEVQEREYDFFFCLTPGDDKNIIDQPAQDWHKRENWREWQAYVDGKTGPIGTPLSELTFLGQELETELMSKKIFTVEQLADAPDAIITAIPEGMRYRKAAQVVTKTQLESSTHGKYSLLQKEMKEKEENIKALQERISDLEARIKNRVPKGDITVA